jgi:hypothetical protein
MCCYSTWHLYVQNNNHSTPLTKTLNPLSTIHSIHPTQIITDHHSHLFHRQPDSARQTPYTTYSQHSDCTTYVLAYLLLTSINVSLIVGFLVLLILASLIESTTCLALYSELPCCGVAERELCTLLLINLLNSTVCLW